MQTAIDMSKISKSFGNVKANENVDFSVNEGEIHALLGENGAGKSTLMNMLAGIYKPDSGQIKIYGQPKVFNSPLEPIKIGIGMIHQHFKLIEKMTAKENIIIGSNIGPIINKKALSKNIKDISDKYKLEIDPDKKVYDMSVGQKQTLEIVKVLYQGAKILIMDEPTAVLTPQETKRLFDIIRQMKKSGCSIIIITHKLNEVMEISDRVTVLRKGQSVGTVETKKTTPKQLIEMMVGKPVELAIKKDKVEKSQTPFLKIEGLNVIGKDKLYKLKDVNLEVYSGEILGIAGLAGSGQRPLCEAIAGLMTAQSGHIYLDNEEITNENPRQIIEKGVRLGFIPEDRLGMGLVGSMDIIDNLLLKDYKNQKGIFINKNIVVPKAEKIIKELEILTRSIHMPVKQMSGGNIQKVLLGREIESNPKLLITAYPVRGLDIGASYKIYDLLLQQRKKGVAVLFIGEDLDILLELCDRIAVIYSGTINGVLDAKSVTKEQVGVLMSGGNLSDLSKSRGEVNA